MVWWQQRAGGVIERAIVDGATVLDAVAEQNRHDDAYAAGRYRIADEATE